MMRKKSVLFIFIINCCLLSIPQFIAAQKQSNLFEGDELIQLNLKGNVKQLLADRGDGKSKYFPFQINYDADDTATIPITIKTRGHFRRIRNNCVYPPLLLNFPKKLTASIFKGQDKLKLVMPCAGENYVVKEWLVYKIYNLVTPQSFKARLVKVKMEDANNDKTYGPFYGMLIEDEKKMAKRNKQVAITKKIDPEQADQMPFFNMAIFEYMIGNTDWCVQYLQNVKLLADDSTGLIPVTVPYDFDHSGIVNTPYAHPAEALLMSDVRERRFRGYCIEDLKNYDSSIAIFNRIKDQVYSLYNNCELLDEKYKKSTIKYLDDFYETINNPALLKKALQYPCDRNGTGNVLIKGLKDDD